MLIIIRFIFLFLFYSVFSFANELITPIPITDSYDEKKALLGKKLFFDVRLSKDNTISCATCHQLENGGDDNLAVSFGVDGKSGVRNSPTVFNARYNFVQFWDGRAKDLQSQAEGPIHNPVEMNSNFKEVISKLSKDRNYINLFDTIYHDGMNALNITDAIAEFEKSLITPNSKFDQYLRGDQDALDEQEKLGFQNFKDYGCISCHNGVNIGGNLYQKIGIIKDFRSSPNDFGRFEITKEKKDIMVFKVPTLRNIALTAPYFHDGSIETLHEAVKIMLEHQIGIELEPHTIDSIVAFLNTLNGEIPKKLLEIK